MQMTEEGLALIRHFEGFRATAYRCPSGVWTIGYGHTGAAGPPPVAPGMTITEAEAGRILEADVATFARGVAQALRREVTDRQFSALVSFAYNIGIAAFRDSSVLKAVNAGDYHAVPRRLQLWVKGGGRVLPGLVTRRAAEAELFLRDAGGPTGTGLGDTGVPEPVPGKPAGRSSTIAAGLVAAIAALASSLSATASGNALLLSLGVAGIAAAAWIIRERLRKAREEGV